MWRHLLVVKIGLFFGFAAVFFVLLWVNLAVVDRLADRRARPRARRRARPPLPAAHRPPRRARAQPSSPPSSPLIAASSAVGQWRNYLLFVNGGSFAVARDPQFHKNVGFFVFTLPFLSFIVSWTLVALIVVTVVSVVAHYLNGGIRVQQGFPQVAPQVKVHVSVLLAAVALVKAVGYFLARYGLDLSQNGYVQGAGYTDVHARLPALTLLFWISLLAAVILLVNISRRGWALPVLAIGLVGLRGRRGRCHLPGPRPGLAGQPGPERARASVHRPQHLGHPGRDRLTDVTMAPFTADQSLTPAAVLRQPGHARTSGCGTPS